MLLLGDCLNALRYLPKHSVDVILTDPPYGVNYRDRIGRSIANDVNLSWLQPAFAEMYRVLAPDSYAVCFYGFNRVDEFMSAWKSAGFRIAGPLAFVKEYASNKGKRSHTARCHENAVLLTKGNPPKSATPPRDVYTFDYSGNRLHPTQKPLATMRQLVQDFSKPGDTVLDPFCGSGTTAHAAILENRDFYTVELDPVYFGKARERLAEVAMPKPKPIQKSRSDSRSNVTPLRRSA
ncbi:MAG: DNA methyltransferase [Cyanobacteria bacterium P01_A01_bin.17]